MADEETTSTPSKSAAQQPAKSSAASRRSSRSSGEESQSEAVKTDDERYVGVDPIYKQSAYEEPLEAEGDPVVDEDASDEEKEAAKEAAEAEADTLERVKANEEGNKVAVEEAESFEEWLPHSAVATRKQSVRGADEEQMEADKQATEDAKGEDGKIPPHSTSAQQPGVITSP